MDSFKGGVVVVAATGNQGPKDERGRMAYPARDAYVVAVGAAALDGRRAAVSRYGSKDLGPGRWFMVRAPESSPGVLAPLVQVGSDTFTNTSIATAMATGLIVSSGLVDVRPPPFFDDVERHARAVAMADAFLTLADAAQVPGYDRREHGDGVLRIPARDAPRSA
jgi:subtilisin family serine protease